MGGGRGFKAEEEGWVGLSGTHGEQRHVFTHRVEALGIGGDGG